MSLSSNFPTIKPSLNLDFANVGALDPRITFTRATTATYTNSLGLIATAASGVARFDYDPVTLAARGLLVEEQRTNLLTYSEQLDNAAWIKSSTTVTANAAAAPDGTVTADLVTWSGSSEIAQISAATNGTLSFWAKGVAGQTLFVGIAGTSTTTTITLSDSWQRYSLSFTGTSTYIYLGKYSGATVTSAYIWGAQLEAGSFATSYIPTVASTVTRNADVATVTTMSPWYNQTEGTLYSEWDISSVSVDRGASVHLTNTAETDRAIVLTSSSTTVRHLVQISSVFQVILDKSPAIAGISKDAYAYKAGSYGASVNGTTALTSAYASVPAAADRLFLGAASSNTSVLNGWLRRVAYYPARLTNAQLQALTS